MTQFNTEQIREEVAFREEESVIELKKLLPEQKGEQYNGITEGKTCGYGR